MKFSEVAKQAGHVAFFVDDDVTADVFRDLINSLAGVLSGVPEWIELPEATIGKINVVQGSLYAKLDYAYGLELDCEGLTSLEVNNIRGVLSSF